MTERRRFPASVYAVGTEPDGRFTLANERTFLAWIRTSLAFIAAGIAFEALAPNMQPGFRIAASAVLIVTGIATPVAAWLEWVRIERALRQERPLPSPVLTLPVVLAIVVVGILVALGFLFA